MPRLAGTKELVVPPSKEIFDPILRTLKPSDQRLSALPMLMYLRR